MSQLQAGSFRGSDVDGLDRIVRRMEDAAEFADDVVTALKVLAAALDAMSWTGWAAAFSRYLRAVVIPWVKTVAQYLRGFAKVLALISQTQKDTSSDSPTVHIPAAAFTPVTLPRTSTANAPQLTAPEPVGSTSAQGGGAAGAGAQVAVPLSIGSITIHVNGADGAGAPVTAPAAPTVRPDATGLLTGSAATVAAPVGVGPVTVPDAAAFAGGSGGGPGGGPAGGGAPAGPSGAGSSGGGVGGGGSLAPVPDAAPAAPDARPAHAVDAGGVAGDPVVRVVPAEIGTSGGADTRAAAAEGMAALESGGGAPVALAAAPLGLAALGAAAMGALRSKGGDDDTAEDAQGGTSAGTAGGAPATGARTRRETTVPVDVAIDGGR